MQTIEEFPLIKKVSLLIAYDNSMIDREEDMQTFLDSCTEIIGADGVYHEDLTKLEKWLGTKTEDELETIASGEQREMWEVTKTSPVNANGDRVITIFEDIFNG